ncbi:MAG: pyridoxamine 5'-phosphate oxidase family protein [Burkholderiales bacterium]
MIDSVDALRALYAQPKGRSLSKELRRLDAHCARFVSLAPLVVVATSGADGRLDCSPRGGEPGFVKLADEHTLLIPDSPGNNRLDSMTNVLATGRIGLLFLIPGVDETLRVNGRGRLSDDPERLALFAGAARAPKLAIVVAAEEVYLHCAKALMRSKLWAAESRNERSVLPSMGQMLNDQTGTAGPAETQEQMVARYLPDL